MTNEIKTHEYYIDGILNDTDNIGMNIFAISENEAMNKAADLIKEKYGSGNDTFDILEVVLLK